MVLPLSPSLWFEINTSTLKFIFNTHSFMFSICIWINKWQVQLLGGISYMTKYGHSCSSQHQESFSEHFSDENQTRIWDQRSEISMVMRDLRRNKNVNQKSLPMIRSFRKKTNSTNCLSNQHTGKTISSKTSVLLQPASNSRPIINE